MRLAIAVASIVLGTACASAAHAHPYSVTACASTATDWTAFNTSPSVLEATATCPATPGQVFGGHVVGARAGTPNTGPGQWASWSLSAPPSTLVRRLTLERYLGTNAEGWVSKVVTAENRELERCERPWWATKCERGTAVGPGAANEVTFPELGTQSVSFIVQCANATITCANGSSVRAAWIAVYRATVMIEDSAPPVVSVLNGTITDPGWHRGTDTANFSALDASGVKRLRLVAGTAELGRQQQPCDYSRMQPCPGQGTASFSVNTARVSDGTHTLRAIAEDAAEQEGSVVGTLRVDRTAPKPPTGLSAERAEDGTYTVAWTNPDQGTAAPIVAAQLALCNPLGTACEPASASTGTGIQRVAGVTFAGAEGPRTLRVWLEDEAGNVDPTASTALPIDTSVHAAPRVLGTDPPILLPSGPKPSPRLRITGARRSGSTLTLTGTIARGATARVSAAVARTRTGKAVARASVRPRRGKWTLRVRLTPALRRAGAMYLSVGYAGQASFRKTTVQRRLAKRPAGRTRASDEFSLEAR